MKQLLYYAHCTYIIYIYYYKMLKTTKVKIDQEKFSFLAILFKRKNSMFTKHFPIGKRFGYKEANIKQF